MGAVLTLTRASLLVASFGCAASADQGIAVQGSERIIGRALFQGRVVMLTNEHVLVTIDPHSQDVARLPLAGRDRSGLKLWGLGEIDNTLYSISGFTDLVRVAPAGAVAEIRNVARLARPVANLVDAASGMSAQLAVDDRGKPIAWRMDASGVLNEMQTPARAPLGMSRAEESLLHLLSCSVPPRVLCWLPGSNQLFTLTGDRLALLAALPTVQGIDPASLLAHPESRSIRDAIWDGGDRLVVIFGDRADSGGGVVAEFGLDGRMIRTIQTPAPVRVFVSADARRILAVARSGALIEALR